MINGIAGVDYGSKLAGTTAIAAIAASGSIDIHQSAKGQDADRFLLEQITSIQAQQIFIDAPLSLPMVYRSPEAYDDYFYRVADRTLQAMSPLFLGGLTARAMQLARRLSELDIMVYEVYPAHLARLLKLQEMGYKKDINQLPDVVQELLPHLPYPLAPQVTIANWHQADALLALLSGIRYMQQQHEIFGNTTEGIIIV